MKKHLLLLVVLIGLVSLYSCTNMGEFFNPDSVVITEIDLSGIEDATYSGEYTIGPVHAVVEVTVSDHAITQIILVEHKTGKGQGAEVIVDRVTVSQSLAVDTISGATISSNCILKAIETALSR